MKEEEKEIHRAILEDIRKEIEAKITHTGWLREILQVFERERPLVSLWIQDGIITASRCLTPYVIDGFDYPKGTPIVNLTDPDYKEKTLEYVRNLQGETEKT